VEAQRGRVVRRRDQGSGDFEEGAREPKAVVSPFPMYHEMAGFRGGSLEGVDCGEKRSQNVSDGKGSSVCGLVRLGSLVPPLSTIRFVPDPHLSLSGRA